MAEPDGTDVTTLLNPSSQPLRGFEAAYGNSLRTFILLSVTQSTGGNKSQSSFVRYFPNTGHRASLQQQLPMGEERAGVPSPDNSKFVAEIGSPTGQQFNLWISNFQTKQYRRLTQGVTQDRNGARATSHTPVFSVTSPSALQSESFSTIGARRAG